MHAGFAWGIPKERDHLEDPGVDGSITLACIFNRIGLTEFMSLRPVTSGGHL
jgi:hypothetical protein